MDNIYIVKVEVFINAECDISLPATYNIEAFAEIRKAKIFADDLKTKFSYINALTVKMGHHMDEYVFSNPGASEVHLENYFNDLNAKLLLETAKKWDKKYPAIFDVVGINKHKYSIVVEGLEVI